MALIWKTAFQSAALFIITALTVVMAVSTTVSAETQTKSLKPVVELFTSQGCSSCPPADAFLGILSKKNNVIALTYAVDYWDYLGWKDTLASPENSERQRSYARFRGDNQVYTPQLIVNGKAHYVGSYQFDINNAITKEQNLTNMEFIPISLNYNALTVTIEKNSETVNLESSGMVWLALVTSSKTINIGRGENSGRTITYYNVVRELVPLGRWSGETISLNIPRKNYKSQDIDQLVVLLQKGKTGPIIGAARYMMDQ